jgi:hypothetical protein
VGRAARQPLVADVWTYLAGHQDPEVREPWLRALHDQPRSQAHAYPRMDPFW